MKKIFIQAAFLTGAMFTLTSCLKDKGFEDGEYGTQYESSSKIATVSLPQSQEGISVFSLDANPPTEEIDAVLVQLASIEAAKEDIQVTLQKNMSLVADYNSSNFTNYIELPANCYEIVSPGGLTVTIPKGQRQAWLRIKLIKNNFDFTQSYAIGYSIGTTSGGNQIAGNYKNMILAITVKNQYDGVYGVVSGKVTRYLSPGVPAGDALSGNLAGNPDVKLITSGPNSVAIPAPANPNPGALYWANGNNSQVAGIDGLSVVVNPTTFNTTITSGINATLANWAGTAPGITYNRYDPATKFMYLAFKWNPTANVREYEIVLRYKGPR